MRLGSSIRVSPYVVGTGDYRALDMAHDRLWQDLVTTREFREGALREDGAWIRIARHMDVDYVSGDYVIRLDAEIEHVKRVPVLHHYEPDFSSFPPPAAPERRSLRDIVAGVFAWAENKQGWS